MSGENRHFYRFKSFRLEVEERQLLHHDQPVPLTPKAFDVLVALVERSSHLVEKEELLHTVWADSFVEEANIARIVHTLRKALGDDGKHHQFIETVAKKGYRFVAQVSEDQKPDAFGGERAPSKQSGKAPEAVFATTGETGDQPTVESNAGKTLRRLFLAGVVLLSLALLLGTSFSGFKLFSDGGGYDFQSIEMVRLTDNNRILSSAISPDGRFVAIVEGKDGRQTLFVQQISTGATITIVPPTLNDFYQPAFTPDSEFIYYIAVDNGIGTLYSVSVLGGESRKLATDVDSSIAFSSDGKRIAFIRHHPVEGGDTLIIANSDGENPEEFLTTRETGFENFIGLDWSPDGEKLLFGTYKSISGANQIKLFTIGLRDKKISEVVCAKTWHSVRMFKWLKDGGGLLLVGRTNNSDYIQIWHLDYPQGTLRQITSDTNNYGLISISADNRTIAATMLEMISSIWSFDPQSKEKKQILSENSYVIGGKQLSQMPNGKILFTKSAGRKTNIFSMNENGEDEKQLTSRSGNNQSPTVSPDGSYIVFSSNRSDFYAIWRMNADGTGAVQLTKPENASDLEPEITSDGKTVIFVRYNTGGGNHKLMKIPIDGGEVSALLPENNAPEYAPRISPDGKQLAFLSFDWEEQTANMKSYVNLIGLDGEQTDLSMRKAEVNIAPDFEWSPDNRSLDFIKKGGIENIWSVSISDYKETPLTDFTSGNIIDFSWSKDGKKLFLTKAFYNTNLVLIKDKGKISGQTFQAAAK